MVLVVMGAAGAGKSTVGALLAARLGYRFLDADSLHSPQNLAKLAAGTPLTDEDRAPWLEALAAEIRRQLAIGEDLVVACSALKRSYRELLFLEPERMRLVYLRGSAALLEARLRARQGHVAGPALLHSQLQLLEEPAAAERAITVEIDAPPEVLVERIERALEAAGAR